MLEDSDRGSTAAAAAMTAVTPVTAVTAPAAAAAVVLFTRAAVEPVPAAVTTTAAVTAATAITLASRFGGGIFSPSLYLGAMTGGAFGLVAASVFPEVASSHGLYAILGMGAVAAAVLGAPVSTTVIVCRHSVSLYSLTPVSIR